MPVRRCASSVARPTDSGAHGAHGARVGIGLSVHWGGTALSFALRDVLGDALCAPMLAWWVGALLPTRGLGARTALALAGCMLVETSQLVHTSWLDALRATRGGEQVLCSGFDPRDLLADAGGVAAAALLEQRWRERERRRRGVDRPGATPTT